MTGNTNPLLIEFQYEKQIVTRTRYETKGYIIRQDSTIETGNSVRRPWFYNIAYGARRRGYYAR